MCSVIQKNQTLVYMSELSSIAFVDRNSAKAMVFNIDKGLFISDVPELAVMFMPKTNIVNPIITPYLVEGDIVIYNNETYNIYDNGTMIYLGDVDPAGTIKPNIPVEFSKSHGSLYYVDSPIHASGGKTLSFRIDESPAVHTVPLTTKFTSPELFDKFMIDSINTVDAIPGDIIILKDHSGLRVYVYINDDNYSFVINGLVPDSVPYPTVEYTTLKDADGNLLNFKTISSLGQKNIIFPLSELVSLFNIAGIHAITLIAKFILNDNLLIRSTCDIIQLNISFEGYSGPLTLVPVMKISGAMSNIQFHLIHDGVKPSEIEECGEESKLIESPTVIINNSAIVALYNNPVLIHYTETYYRKSIIFKNADGSYSYVYPIRSGNIVIEGLRKGIMNTIKDRNSYTLKIKEELAKHELNVTANAEQFEWERRREAVLGDLIVRQRFGPSKIYVKDTFANIDISTTLTVPEKFVTLKGVDYYTKVSTEIGLERRDEILEQNKQKAVLREFWLKNAKDRKFRTIIGNSSKYCQKSPGMSINTITDPSIVHEIKNRGITTSDALKSFLDTAYPAPKNFEYVSENGLIYLRDIMGVAHNFNIEGKYMIIECLLNGNTGKIRLTSYLDHKTKEHYKAYKAT